jgi:hypothetical protein
MSKTNSAPASSTTPTTSPAAAGKTDQGKGGGGHKSATLTAPSKQNVLALPGMCLTEGCKKRSEKANFCMEHFDWFKEGLVTKEGRKPSDFDKKFFDYTRRLAKKKTA